MIRCAVGLVALLAGCSTPGDRSHAGARDASNADASASAWSGRIGAITLSQFGFVAEFAENVPAVDASRLDETVVDAGAESCSGIHQVGPQSSAGILETTVSAGTLALTVGGVTTDVAQQSVAGAVSYQSGMAFAPGDVVTIRASGAVVPPFSLTISMPAPTTFVLPAMDAGTLTIDRSRDLLLAWTGGDPTDGQVLITINEGSGDATSMAGTFVNCVLPARARGAVIPTSLLGEYLVPSGADGGPSAFISVASYATKVASADDWVITATATSTVSVGSWQGGATVQ